MKKEEDAEMYIVLPKTCHVRKCKTGTVVCWAAVKKLKSEIQGYKKLETKHGYFQSPDGGAKENQGREGKRKKNKGEKEENGEIGGGNMKRIGAFH